MKKIFTLVMAAMGWMAMAASTYTKVTAEPASWAGEYLIVCEKAGVAMNGKAVTEASQDGLAVSITDGKITIADDSYAFTITAKTGGYSIRGDKYIGSTSNSNALKVSANDDYTNTIAWNSTDKCVDIVSTSTAVLRCNTGNSNQFRFFKSSSYTSQAAITLYKKEGGAANPAASISLNKTSVALSAGQKLTLVATTVGENAGAACTDAVSWSSSAMVVASVDQSGVVKAISAGKTTITATAGSKTATCEVTVSDATSIVLSFPADEQKAVQGYTTEWTATMSGHTWTLNGWNNNNNSWAYIRANASTNLRTIASDKIEEQIGKVAVTIDQISEGVTLELVDDDSEQGVYPFTVDGAGVYEVMTEKKGGVAFTLNVKVPTNPTGKTIQISKIEYCIGDNEPTTETAVSGVTLNMSSKELEVEATQQLTATVSPSTAENKNVSWSSDKPAVATVSETGLVTAIAVGTAVITVTTVDGGYTATCTITVKAKSVEPGPGPDPKEEEDPAGTAYTGTFSKADWTNAENVWVLTNSKNGNGYTAGQGVQVTTGTSGAVLESVDEYSEVNGVRINYCTNKSSGTGKFDVKVGDNEAKSVSAKTAYEAYGAGGDGTKLRDATVLYDPAEEGKVRVTITCGGNSVFVNSITIFGTKKVSTGIGENVNVNENVKKVVVNGRMIIERDGMRWSVLGERID